MRETGRYADGRSYDLPAGWERLDQTAAERAVQNAVAAFDGAVERLRCYYDPRSDYAGGLLTRVERGPDHEVTAADLFAVSALSIDVPARTARALLYVTERRRAVNTALRRFPAGMSLGALDGHFNIDGALLDAMWTLQSELKTLPDSTSNSWVFAAKLCARKRPYLFPVRDRVVCQLLKGGTLTTRGIGNFSADIQVFAYLVTSSEITGRLTRLRDELEEAGLRSELEASDLRLLDVVLRTSGIGHWSADSTPHGPRERSMSR